MQRNRSEEITRRKEESKIETTETRAKAQTKYLFFLRRYGECKRVHLYFALLCSALFCFVLFRFLSFLFVLLCFVDVFVFVFIHGGICFLFLFCFCFCLLLDFFPFLSCLIVVVAAAAAVFVVVVLASAAAAAAALNPTNVASPFCFGIKSLVTVSLPHVVHDKIDGLAGNTTSNVNIMGLPHTHTPHPRPRWSSYIPENWWLNPFRSHEMQ